MFSGCSGNINILGLDNIRAVSKRVIESHSGLGKSVLFTNSLWMLEYTRGRLTRGLVSSARGHGVCLIHCKNTDQRICKDHGIALGLGVPARHAASLPQVDKRHQIRKYLASA
ncbi:uncharacterized protein H6S33_005360 [Morchella sextelata]|uniref:uncharacterized protein n=1 Tax=Morchella sextelata TaxID=1174677 RepID=UPI001D05A615|nr:uncharacterized protein H6S33_005360 [Morchella sextelata]KAH0613474.1 hypothetical protein H6S33_005360 [Morchella sextelata]